MDKPGKLEVRRIVVLGASVSGLGVAHALAKRTLPSLLQSSKARYELHLVDQSTHFWWHHAAPRAIVSVSEMKHSDCFVPIMDNFTQYKTLQDHIFFHHGHIDRLDVATKTVHIKLKDGQEELAYHALIIATGNLSPTPLTTLHGDHTITKRALEDMNARLAEAQTVVIGGGGPIAVETAGELATHLNQAKITLVTGSQKILPILKKPVADKAARMLEGHGVTIRYGVKIISTLAKADKTEVKLDNGETILTDVYLPCVGVKPSTDFLPDAWKRSGGYVDANKQTLRVDLAGPLIYAVGDVADADTGGVLNILSSLPVANANIRHDLLKDGGIATASAEKKYQPKTAETQLVPVGRKTGVGAAYGWSVPGFLVSFAKGRDYMLGQMPPLTTGSKW